MWGFVPIDEHWSAEGVASVQSVYDILIAYNGGLVPQNQAVIDMILAQIPADVTTSIIPTGQLAIILIKLETGTPASKQQNILDNLRSMTTASGIPPGVTLTFTGNSAIQQDMGDDLGSNMIILLGRSHCSDGDCLQTPV